MKKTIERAETENAYKKLADEKADGGDLAGALGLYFTVLNSHKKDLDAIADVADCYADMGLLELSNRYWFDFLTVCPKDKQAVAYEELAINYFYMDNVWASGYYFHLKIERDGFIAEEGIDEEIIKFFSSAEGRKSDYFIAYPFDKADYSSVAKSAKRAVSVGSADVAAKIYSRIPAECRTEEISGDYATALFLEKRDDEMIEVCKDSVARHGDNVNAYCNLSSLYHARGDDDKANYYYKKALSSRKGDDRENYKILTCAIERGDAETVKDCMSVLLRDRTYDDLLNFFYGVALMNSGDYAGGAKAFGTAYRLNPDDSVYGYYSALAARIAADNSLANGVLPMQYEKSLPSGVLAEYEREVKKYFSGKKNGLRKTEDFNIALKATLLSDDIKAAKLAAVVLGTSGSEKDKEILFSALLGSDADDDVKISIVYLLIAGGEKRKIYAVFGGYFCSVKPHKTVFEGKADGGAYTAAYALAMAKAMPWGIEETAKIAFNMNTLYADYGELLRFNGMESEREILAAVCFLMCGFSRFEKPETVCAAFDVKKEDVKRVAEFYLFVSETKTAAAKERASKNARKRGEK